MTVQKIGPTGAAVNPGGATVTPHPSATDAKNVSNTETKGPVQPTRKLPTDRISFSKQLDILRAYGLASAGGTKAVHYKDVAEVIEMSANSVSLMNTFMADNGFAVRSGNDFMPDRALIEFSQAHGWNPENAPKKLAPLIRRTWFGERMLMRLKFRAMSVGDMVADLASQIGATKEFKPQIETLIEYAEVCGLVRRDGTQLSIGDQTTADAASSPPLPTQENPMPQPETRSDPPAPKAGTVATGFMSTEGGIQFHVGIKVDMSEMAGWTPDRITAFFSGLAQVLAAKKGTETV